MAIYFLTGINGFIGSHMAEKLLSEGHTVRGLIRETSDLSLIGGLDLQLSHGDITQPETLETPLQGVDVVIHIAGLASDWGPFDKFYDINVRGTQNLAKAAEKANVKRFVHISTVALYGFGYHKPVDESIPMAKTIFPYNETKKMAEQMLFEFAKQSEMEVTAIQPGNVFGPKDHTFIDQYLEAMEQGKIAFINGGLSRTCPTYIENLVDGIYKSSIIPEAKGETFIITDGLKINWKIFTNALADEMDLKRPKLSVPFWLVYSIAFLLEMIYKLFSVKKAPLLTRYRISNGGKDYYFSIAKAKKILGYKPLVDFEESIRRTVAWYKHR